MMPPLRSCCEGRPDDRRRPDSSIGVPMKKHLAMVTLLLGALALLPALAQQQDAAGLKDLQSDTAKFHRRAPARFRTTTSSSSTRTYPSLTSSAWHRTSSAIEQRADDVMRIVGAVPTYVYTHAIHGFAAQMTEEEALKLSEDDRVAFVEEDSVVEANITQNNPPWGLDRIDQRTGRCSTTYTYTTTGSGVNAYIIDTGIRRAHTQFAGRASRGVRRHQRRAERPTIATVTARTWPERSADRPTASRRPCGCLPCASSAAAARAPTRGSSRE